MAIDFVDLPINSMVIFPIVMLVHRRVPDIYRGTLNIDANPRDVVFCRHIHLVPQIQRLIYHQFSLKKLLGISRLENMYERLLALGYIAAESVSSDVASSKMGKHHGKATEYK